MDIGEDCWNIIYDYKKSIEDVEKKRFKRQRRLYKIRHKKKYRMVICELLGDFKRVEEVDEKPLPKYHRVQICNNDLGVCIGVINDYLAEQKNKDKYPKYKYRCSSLIITPEFREDGTITYTLPRTGIFDLERLNYELGSLIMGIDFNS